MRPRTSRPRARRSSTSARQVRPARSRPSAARGGSPARAPRRPGRAWRSRRRARPDRRLPQVRRRRELPHLVRLQPADEVPPHAVRLDAVVGELGHLGQQLLRVVLADVDRGRRRARRARRPGRSPSSPRRARRRRPPAAAIRSRTSRPRRDSRRVDGSRRVARRRSVSQTTMRLAALVAPGTVRPVAPGVHAVHGVGRRRPARRRDARPSAARDRRGRSRAGVPSLVRPRTPGPSAPRRVEVVAPNS